MPEACMAAYTARMLITARNAHARGAVSEKLFGQAVGYAELEPDVLDG